jgi:hypothetical protein
MSKNKSSLIIPDKVLVNKIFLLRNQKVMLDRDLAELYSVKAIRFTGHLQGRKFQPGIINRGPDSVKIFLR